MVRVVDEHTSTSVDIRGMLSFNVGDFGRVSYLFRTKFGDNSAVLKLSWTSVNRQPEGALVSKAWGVDIDYLSKFKREYGRVAGTDRFKTIRVSLGYHQQHSILDDIESLLYAMLAIFAYIRFWHIRMPQSRIQVGIPELPAMSKVGGMADSATYPEHFGICSTILSKV
ncbi:hypothetical protein LPJ66_001848 [Kickxella alabastrina]|uniref:Uncharacterized protein n=1 Tax=Kickxella alabastrina TaxID=61397 RepID=A0ACC1IS29_9FUNG|nr:hypothetical protein LPJ66_001848 [Kickxella alabastrina]